MLPGFNHGWHISLVFHGHDEIYWVLLQLFKDAGGIKSVAKGKVSYHLRMNLSLYSAFGNNIPSWDFEERAFILLEITGKDLAQTFPATH